MVYGPGLENQRNESYRGFESHPLRFILAVWPSGKAKDCKFFTPQFESGCRLCKKKLFNILKTVCVVQNPTYYLYFGEINAGLVQCFHLLPIVATPFFPWEKSYCCEATIGNNGAFISKK